MIGGGDVNVLLCYAKIQKILDDYALFVEHLLVNMNSIPVIDSIWALTDKAKYRKLSHSFLIFNFCPSA